MIRSNPNHPTFLFDNLPINWLMSRGEKYTFVSLLEAANPDVAIEIGTYEGGSLQILSKKAKKVFSLDIASNCDQTPFDNVEFLIGDSKQLLPSLLDKISNNKESLGFILIDGDHSTEGVRADINSVLKYVPIRPLYIVFHDSFHPACREGIIAADWQQCEHVHLVEIDFLPGIYIHEAVGHAQPRSMWGGFSLALMLPEKRTHELIIHQSNKGLFDVLVPHSVHAVGPLRKILRKIKRKLIR
jgi:hypothetical protein